MSDAIWLAIVGGIPSTIAAIAAWHAASGTSRSNRTLGDVKEAVNGSATAARVETEALRVEVLALKAEIARLYTQLSKRPPRRKP